MSAARAETAEEVIEEMEAKLEETEQREILARLKHSRERLPAALVARVTALMAADPDTYRSTFLHVNIYSRILDLDEAGVKRLIAHFAARYQDPDWDAGHEAHQRELRGEEVHSCATPGCQGENYRRGLCFRCREREPERVLLEKLDTWLDRVMVRQ